MSQDLIHMGDLDLGYCGWSNVKDSFEDTATLDTPLEKKAIEPKPLLANSRPYSIIISDTPSFSFTLFSFSLPPSASPPLVSPLISLSSFNKTLRANYKNI